MRSTKTQTAIYAGVVGIAAAMLATLTAAPAAAVDARPASGMVIAADATAEPAMKAAAIVGVDANLPRGLTVSGHAGKPIILTATGTKVRIVKPTGSKPVAITDLIAGKAYRVSVNGKTIGTATPLAVPAATTKLTVATTSTTGAVKLTWTHLPAKDQGAVEFVATATPIGVLTAKSAPTPLEVTSRERSAVIDGLDTDTLYEFSVVARNTAASGKASTATMTKPLSALAPTAAPATPSPAPTQAPPAPAAPVASAPAPAKPSGGGGSSAPAMRTELYCADGYTLADDVCMKTIAYTYTTQTQDYTYTTVTPAAIWHGPNSWTTQEWDAGGGGNVTAPADGNCSVLGAGWSLQSGNGHWRCIKGGYVTVTHTNPGWWEYPAAYQVKDATPTGWTDNGTAWTREVKDTTPTGYADTGAAWVKTIAALTRQVPA